jgi:threonine dehydratase
LAVETPLIESPALNDRLGGRVLLKPETLQRAGAFKFRGAYNRLSQLTADERRRGVVAFSSGNHAQGVALAAQLIGCPALIVMPSDSPAVKVAGTKRLRGRDPLL